MRVRILAATALLPWPACPDEITYRFRKAPSVRVGALASDQVQVIEGGPA